MTPVRDRTKTTATEVTRFGLVGVAATAANLGLFAVLTQVWHVWGPLASAVSVAVSTLVAYLGNRRWTYRHSRGVLSERRALWRFIVASAAGLLIESAAVAVVPSAIGSYGPGVDNAAKAFVGLPLATLFRFWAFRTWVFRPVAVRPAPDSALS
ncbi:GtrA family protein [Streptomyces pathocidini]|uniref:GtrA family protein n=1 Tax=Streptomyces pathocidini TaxID=1650571 RepID=A0ABW7ULF0_9ACTN|nr:GtrA family protein [Streptomyces pathocidini]